MRPAVTVPHCLERTARAAEVRMTMLPISSSRMDSHRLAIRAKYLQRMLAMVRG